MAKTYLYDTINVVSSAIDEDNWEKLFDNMSKSGWYGTEGQRKGFMHVVRDRGIIAGYFANEGRKKAILYDNNKEQLDPPLYYSFEHLFFAIFEDTAQILLQSRNIYDYADLGLPEIRNNLKQLLTDLFRLSGIYVVGNVLQLESAGIIYSQEQLYSTFVTLARVSELRISDLYGASPPSPDDPQYKLYNPKDEWESIIWGVVADTLESGLDSVTMSSLESMEGTLQAPIPKALAAVGSIQTVKGYDSQGRLIYRQHSEEAELEIELPIHPEIVPDLLERIMDNFETRGRVESWQDRQKRREEHQDRNIFTDLD